MRFQTEKFQEMNVTDPMAYKTLNALTKPLGGGGYWWVQNRYRLNN